MRPAPCMPAHACLPMRLRLTFHLPPSCVNPPAYRVASTGEEGASTLSQTLVKREHLVEACGEAAKTLKSYQLVGINFLMMLHKSESVGE